MGDVPLFPYVNTAYILIFNIKLLYKTHPHALCLNGALSCIDIVHDIMGDLPCYWTTCSEECVAYWQQDNDRRRSYKCHARDTLPNGALEVPGQSKHVSPKSNDLNASLV